jgi:hypothetical protein
MITTPPVRKPRDYNRAAVLNALLNGPETPARLLQMTGLSDSGLRYILDYLEKARIVVRRGYTLQRLVMLSSHPQAAYVPDPPKPKKVARVRPSVEEEFFEDDDVDAIEVDEPLPVKVKKIPLRQPRPVSSLAPSFWVTAPQEGFTAIGARETAKTAHTKAANSIGFRILQE